MTKLKRLFIIGLCSNFFINLAHGSEKSTLVVNIAVIEGDDNVTIEACPSFSGAFDHSCQNGTTGNAYITGNQTEDDDYYNPGLNIAAGILTDKLVKLSGSCLNGPYAIAHDTSIGGSGVLYEGKIPNPQDGLTHYFTANVYKFDEHWEVFNCDYY